MNIKDTRLQNFRRVLEEKNLKLKDISYLLDKAPSQISAFAGKNPTKGIGDHIAREIERALELHNGYLDLPYVLDEFNSLTVMSAGSRRLPVLNAAQAASWCQAQAAQALDEHRVWMSAPGPVGPRAFILMIDGVSMEPMFGVGDRVVIDPSVPVVSGSFAAVKREGHDGVLLRKFTREGDEEYLHAINPNWPDRILKRSDEWEIFGSAKWKITEL